MRKDFCWIVVAMLITPFCFSPVWAADCFCLTNKARNLVVRLGCTASAVPYRTTTVVKCRKSMDTFETVEVTDAAKYEHLADGQGLCTPCNPPVKNSIPDDSIRTGPLKDSK